MEEFMNIYEYQNLPQGALYQLETQTQLEPGTGVAINGPYDKIGFVVKSELQENGKYLNLIRGRGQKVPKGFYASVSF